MKIISFWGEETNPFVNPELSHNGGGYSQPAGGALIKLDNNKLYETDYFLHDCGDFGRTIYFTIREISSGKTWHVVFGSEEQPYDYTQLLNFKACTDSDLIKVLCLTANAVDAAIRAKGGD